VDSSKEGNRDGVGSNKVVNKVGVINNKEAYKAGVDNSKVGEVSKEVSKEDGVINNGDLNLLKLSVLKIQRLVYKNINQFI
jgi:hypothetical protein